MKLPRRVLALIEEVLTQAYDGGFTDGKRHAPPAMPQAEPDVREYLDAVAGFTSINDNFDQRIVRYTIALEQRIAYLDRHRTEFDRLTSHVEHDSLGVNGECLWCAEQRALREADRV